MTSGVESARADDRISATSQPTPAGLVDATRKSRREGRIGICRSALPKSGPRLRERGTAALVAPRMWQRE